MCRQALHLPLALIRLLPCHPLLPAASPAGVRAAHHPPAGAAHARRLAGVPAQAERRRRAARRGGGAGGGVPLRRSRAGCTAPSAVHPRPLRRPAAPTGLRTYSVRHRTHTGRGASVLRSGTGVGDGSNGGRRERGASEASDSDGQKAGGRGEVLGAVLGGSQTGGAPPVTAWPCRRRRGGRGMGGLPAALRQRGPSLCT